MLSQKLYSTAANVALDSSIKTFVDASLLVSIPVVLMYAFAGAVKG